MTRKLPPVRLSGGTVLRDGLLKQGAVALRNGVFDDGAYPTIDLTGHLLLPGIIDMFAHPTGSLEATDAALAENGVTTAFVAHPWVHPDEALSEFDRYRTGALTDLRPALVIETRTVATAPALLAAVERFGISLAYFSEAGEADDPPGIAAALRAQIPRHLCTLATSFDTLDVRYGSLGIASAELREYLSLIGAKLCALPGTTGVALAADAVGDPVLGSAARLLDGPRAVPNTLSLVQSGHCAALVSESDPASLRAAADAMASGEHFADAWAMVSDRPARLLGFTDRGRIAQGLRADLVAVNEATRSIELTISAGRITHASREMAARISSAIPTIQSIAAE